MSRGTGRDDDHGSVSGTETPVKYPSPAAAIAVDVLTSLVGIEPGDIGLRQLSQSLGVPRSTLHRILRTLEAKGMVQRTERSGYALGSHFQELGIRHRVSELPRLSQPVLRDLHARTGETVNLAIPHDDAMLVIDAVQSSAPLRMVSAVGMRDQFHASALGKSWLAALSDPELEQVLDRLVLSPLTQRTITEARSLKANIEKIRSVGYAVDDGESTESVRCVGAAIRSEGDRPVAAISVSGPANRLTKGMISQVGLHVVRAAANISGLLGATGTSEPGPAATG